MTTLNNDELRQKLEHMFISTQQDGAGIAMGRKSTDGTPYKSRIVEFTDMAMQLIATHDQQLLEAILERAENSLSVASTNPKRVYSMKPHKAVPVEHIKSVFKKEGEQMDKISLCSSCHCMTHIIDGRCGKCGGEK